MRKLLLLSFFLCAISCFQHKVYAQGYTRNNLVKINPLSLGLLTINGSYERVISFNTSLQLGLFYTHATVFGTSWRGIGVTPEARIYLGKGKPRAKLTPVGFYIAPFARLQVLAISAEMPEQENQAKASLSNVSGGATVGYQFLWGRRERFSLDIFVGPSFEKAKVVLEGGAREENFGGLGNFSGLSARSGLTVGVAF